MRGPEVMKNDLVSRWANEQFLLQAGNVLRLLSQSGHDLDGLDLRGIRIGPDDHPEVHEVGLQDRMIRGVDFSFAVLECSFIGSRLGSTAFSNATLDNVAFMKALVSSSRFDSCNFLFCGFDDASIADCNFAGARFKQRRHLACSAVRAKIEGSDFSRCRFEGMQFRASEFISCRFEGASFSFCDFRGTRFVGSAPESSRMQQCVLDGAMLDGQPLRA